MNTLNSLSKNSGAKHLMLATGAERTLKICT